MEIKKEPLQKHGDGAVTRREFLQKGALLTGSLAATNTLVDFLGSSPAHAAQVDPNDPALISSEVKFTAADGATVGGYLVFGREPRREPRFPRRGASFVEFCRHEDWGEG
jgi:hypothetical protein